jgi:hypothetical protein
MIMIAAITAKLGLYGIAPIIYKIAHTTSQFDNNKSSFI